MLDSAPERDNQSVKLLRKDPAGWAPKCCVAQMEFAGLLAGPSSDGAVMSMAESGESSVVSLQPVKIPVKLQPPGRRFYISSKMRQEASEVTQDAGLSWHFVLGRFRRRRPCHAQRAAGAADSAEFETCEVEADRQWPANCFSISGCCRKLEDPILT